MATPAPTAPDPWAAFNPQPLAAATKDDPWAAFNPKPLVAPADASAAGEQPGLLSRAADAISGAAGAVKRAVVGQNEFDYPEIVPALGDVELMSRLNRARGEEGMVDILKEADPNLQTAKDKFGNIVVNFKGNPYYLNRSGLSARDATEFGRDMLLTAPFSGAAGAVTRGLSLPFRVAAQAVAGGAGSLATDAASTAAGSQQGPDVVALLASILGGAGGEMLGSTVAAVVNKIRNSPARFIDPNTGQLTQAGVDLFGEAGIDVNDVTQRLSREFSERVGKTGAGAATAREVAAGEFGVPLTRGQASGDFDQIAFEQAAKAGARGETAGRIVREQFENQNRAIQEARSGLGDEFGPQVQNMSPQESAAMVRGGVQAREAAHGEMVGAAWEQARDLAKGTYVPKADIADLPNVAKAALRSDPRFYTPADAVDQYPKTLAAMKLFEKWGDLDIGEITTKSGTGVTPQGVAVELIDEFRKMLSGRNGLLSEATLPGDRVRLGAIVKGFNEWLNGVQDDALMRGAKGAQAFEQFRNARKASARHFDLFDEHNLPAGRRDKAGATLQRMIAEDVSPQEVANWLWGTGKVGDSGDAYRLAKRLAEIFPADSQEWQALKRGFWTRLTTEAEGKTQPGAQAMAQNILEFANGRGGALAKVLFSPDELSKMRRFAATLKNTLPPPDATNPSKTGYELARLGGGIFAAGDMNLPVRMFLRFTDQTRNIGPALRAVTTPGGAPVVRTPASPFVPAAIAAGAGQATQGQGQ